MKLSRTARLVERAISGLAGRARLAFRPRRFQAFGVGTPKSGTRSLAGLFERSYRAAHEPEAEALVAMIDLEMKHGIERERVAQFFRRRDRRLRLELESSHPTAFFLETLLVEFPGAKFILTIRDCYSWLLSVCGQFLRLPKTHDYAFWGKMRDAYYRPDLYPHAPEERVLAAHGLYSLDGYFAFWARHNTEVLTRVPRERLLVVRTHEIRRDAERIAGFLGVPPESLDTSRAHLNRAQAAADMVWEIDPRFVQTKADLHCRDLMARFFPEVRSLENVKRGAGSTG
jgi:hypothetical protein